MKSTLAAVRGHLMHQEQTLEQELKQMVEVVKHQMQVETLQLTILQ